jgi:hypothetical protein
MMYLRRKTIMNDYIAKWSYRDAYGNSVPCHCTNCGCRAHTETGNAGCQTIEEDILSKFCPNCGARMIKEEKE